MIPKQRIQGIKGKPGRQFQYELSFMQEELNKKR
ncbi:hypothetical protein CLV42_11671 [Chitinophaga ginsengisoli]|uniref:Uncharacterized protein n=1 Tax=Chitinophaga ginsengisoli TaxID=363837 RepID=A0A2P8FR00_9BACT|nr:hypothetical protein CLV42_11671 [Chitinophaga ginsengisoli]